MTSFNPMDEPEQCPMCNDHPAWEEIAEDLFECRNCGAVIGADGEIYKAKEQ